MNSLLIRQGKEKYTVMEVDKMLVIEKITDKVEELDVKGQGCDDDCKYYEGYSFESGTCEYKETAFFSTWF
ncbi:hypothetical protein CHI14_03330 [Paenibacillus sp. 7516]|nr:hypothetical protein CHI14_03330 [Paenibacillus sp. 7516]